MLVKPGFHRATGRTQQLRKVSTKSTNYAASLRYLRRLQSFGFHILQHTAALSAASAAAASAAATSAAATSAAAASAAAASAAAASGELYGNQALLFKHK